MFFICQDQQSPYLSKLNATRCKMDTEYKEYSNPTMTLQTVWVYHDADDQSVSKICTRQQNIYLRQIIATKILIFPISDSDLETPRSRSWVLSKGRVIQSAQYYVKSLPFHLASIRPTIPEIELFRNLWVRSKVKVTYCTQYPTNALSFSFTSIGPPIPEIWPK